MKRYLFVSLLAILLLGAGCAVQPSTSSFSEPVKQSIIVSSTVKQMVEKTPVVKTKVKELIRQPKKAIPAEPVKSEVSNRVPNGTYTNSAGNEVPSPYEAPSVPVGASAQCRDGTYSFSQSRRGTCSHHGGVADWL